MILSVDVDGVLADWEGRARALLQDEFGLNLPVSTSWDAIREAVSEEQWGWLWEPRQEHELFHNAVLMPGAKEALAALQEAGHHIAISTCVPPAARVYRAAWLLYNDLPYDSLHFPDKLGNKGLVAAHLYVDDSPEVLQSLLSTRYGALVGVRQPWNKTFEAQTVGRGVYWVDGIADLPRVVASPREHELLIVGA